MTGRIWAGLVLTNARAIDIDAFLPGQPLPDDRLDGGGRGPGLAPVRDDRARQGAPRDEVDDEDGRPLRAEEDADHELDARTGARAVRDVVKVVSHARDSEAAPSRGQAWTDAEKAPAGSSLPAVASFW
ncbi:hypothetical protein FV226_25130 [Methylobacterium sp. WL12]|uniref:hypothetical protein n=1 Tax=Methylobacterium sp. WL12 TaxID=2603890 RepID=UPI0011C8D177|nr:hypothetical protein [Methylobacterium sp. WL12]TXM65385.1 hypothetical protein FV226_25130 [Methylobacterium sp. WL12]